jgi:hypothetical protein
LATARDKARRVRPSVFPPSADFTFEQDEERIRGIAFANNNVPGRELDFVGAGDKPLQLLVAEIGEYIDFPERGCGSLWGGRERAGHDTLLKY